MKQILISCLCIFEFGIGNAQTISPSQNNEYCPNVEYTFTVTIPKSYQSMIGINGCYVTQQPSYPIGSTFTFKGKFGDSNQKQTFRIVYTDNSSQDFDFKKIKSLYFGTSCTAIPNKAAVTVPLCQVVNIPVSFSNVGWGTAFESSDYCFGSITTYEYALPVGWKIGTTVSTGTNWIPGGNSVIVTSDLTDGANGYIYFRPTNNCGSGLTNGTTPGVIPILRPAPNLTITGSTDYICSGSATYTINGLPAGASVQWSISDHVNASIASSTLNTVTIARITPYDASVVLTANVTACSANYTTTHLINLGKPFYLNAGYEIDGSTHPIQVWTGSSSDYNQLCIYHTATTQFSFSGAQSAAWARTYTSPSSVTWQPNGANMSTYFFGGNQFERFSLRNQCMW